MSDTTEVTPTDPWALSPKQAAEKLAAMTKEYNTAAANGGQSPQPTLDQILADQRAAAEQRSSAALIGHLTDIGLSPSIEAAGAEVLDYVEGRRSITPQMRAAVDAKIKAWDRDADFQKRLLHDGDPEARKLLGIACSMRIARVEEAKT